MSNIDPKAKNTNIKRQELELRKLEIEIGNLSKQWWKKPGIIVTLLIGFSTLFTGVLTGWFSNEYKLIELKRTILERDIEELQRKELSSRIILRLETLFKDKELNHPGNPSAKDLIRLLRTDPENRKFYTHLLIDHLNSSPIFEERIMILYILNQGILNEPSQSRNNSNTSLLPNSEWQKQFFALVEENWERPEIDKIIQLGDWELFDPYSFVKWTELIQNDISKINDNEEVKARAIRREYYRLIPDNIILESIPNDALNQAIDVYSIVGGIEAGFASHEIFGYVRGPKFLFERKVEVINRFSKFLNKLNSIDNSNTLIALAFIMHQIKIAPPQAKHNLVKPIEILFSGLSTEIRSSLIESKFPAYNSQSMRLDIDDFNSLKNRKSYIEWITSFLGTLDSNAAGRASKFIDVFMSIG